MSTGTRSTSPSGTPPLVQEGLIDPGPGVATFFPSAARIPAGNIGISYMQSSSHRVRLGLRRRAHRGHAAGLNESAGWRSAPGRRVEAVSFRNGDYGTAVYDPGTGLFWAANEYAGADASSNIWRTKIASFSLFSGVGTDFYSVNANAGDHLHFATSDPGRRTAGVRQQLLSRAAALRPERQPGGHCQRQRGRRPQLGHRLHGARRATPASGPSRCTPSPNTPTPTQGEYGLLATGATGALAAVHRHRSTIPADGPWSSRPRLHRHLQRTGLRAVADPGRADDQRRAGHRGHPVVDAITVDWTLDPSYLGTGNRPAQRGDHLGRRRTGNRVEDVSGQTLADFTSPSTTTRGAVRHQLVGHDGEVFSPAPDDLTEVVTFSEPMDTSFTTASSFDLFGIYRNQSHTRPPRLAGIPRARS